MSILKPRIYCLPPRLRFEVVDPGLSSVMFAERESDATL